MELDDDRDAVELAVTAMADGPGAAGARHLPGHPAAHRGARRARSSPTWRRPATRTTGRRSASTSRSTPSTPSPAVAAAAALGGADLVNSIHHQAVADPGPRAAGHRVELRRRDRSGRGRRACSACSGTPSGCSAPTPATWPRSAGWWRHDAPAPVAVVTGAGPGPRSGHHPAPRGRRVRRGDRPPHEQGRGRPRWSTSCRRRVGSAVAVGRRRRRPRHRRRRWPTRPRRSVR